MPTGGGRVILLVDDDELVRSGAAAVLESSGYHVLAAGTAEEALGLLRGAEAVDVLVTDFAMPDMSGVELVREVQRGFPAVAVLVMTGHAENPREVSGMAVIHKPFQAETLIEELERIIARKERTAGI